ncbi:MAG: RIP metalloprotease RseP, partial [Pseudobdellovibrionaceae bacterium]|nr:RIP metalloprotease RseP [Pseudobdellovibrionaceae bacterium]
ESQSYAYEVGFRSGDLIVAVDDQQVRSWDEVQEVLTHKVNQEVRFQVTRLGFEQPIVVKAVPRLVPNPNPLQLRSEIGAIEGVSLDSWSPVIGVTGKTLAYQMGFRTGDRVVAINDQPIKFFRDLEPKLVALQGAEVTVEILRQQGGSEGHSEAAQEKVTLNIKLPDIMPSLNSFGIEKPLVYIYSVVKDSPAEAAGLKPYDKIIEINGHNVSKWEDVLNLVKNHNYSEPLQFVVERDDAQQFTFKIQPQETELLTPQGKAEKRKTVGILPLIDFVEPSFTRVDYSFGESVLRAIVRSYEVSLMTVMSFVRLIQNKISPKTIGGVISIGQVASQSFKMGWYHFFNMMAIISINLFVLNLLPIPVLDGGHLLFYTLEAIRGAPISMRKMEIAQQVGLVLLLALMSFALFNDFSRLFGF